MSDTVETIFGLVARDDLEVTDHVTEDSNTRAIKTEWRLLRDLAPMLEFVYDDGRVVRSVKGELVKASAHVEIKRGSIMGAAQVNL